MKVSDLLFKLHPEHNRQQAWASFKNGYTATVIFSGTHDGISIYECGILYNDELINGSTDRQTEADINQWLKDVEDLPVRLANDI